MQARRSKGSLAYEKKFLHLAIIKVQRGDTEDVAQASHGTVVINLADFTAMQQGPKKLAFRVSVTKEITGALARIGKTETPTLIITLTCVLFACQCSATGHRMCSLHLSLACLELSTR
jgi:hypothetical protein